MKTYNLSQTAMVASTINHLSGLMLGNEIEQTQATIGMYLSLSALLPTSATTDEERSLTTYIALVANITGLSEIEGKALTLIKYDTGKVDEVIKLTSIIQEIKERTADNEVYLFSIADIIMPFVFGAGVSGLKEGFEELEALAQEVTE